jgi:hypothetical protein
VLLALVGLQAGREVSTALSMDYPAPAAEKLQCGFERPLDRLALPLHRAITLKTAAEAEPGELRITCVGPGGTHSNQKGAKGHSTDKPQQKQLVFSHHD